MDDCGYFSVCDVAQNVYSKNVFKYRNPRKRRVRCCSSSWSRLIDTLRLSEIGDVKSQTSVFELVRPTIYKCKHTRDNMVYPRMYLTVFEFDSILSLLKHLFECRKSDKIPLLHFLYVRVVVCGIVC